MALTEVERKTFKAAALATIWIEKLPALGEQNPAELVAEAVRQIEEHPELYVFLD